MTTASKEELHYFALAFELAYCIHVNKDVAFFVAEDALDGLTTMLGRHEKDRRPLERLRGFLKSGERTRPVRKTIRLNERQTLQWLVYKQSEFWERQIEQGEGVYLPTEEDLIVRYVKHLVFTTLRGGSFYVTLAAGSLLRQFSRRETRLFYDILTQSDSARMKDTNYIGKRRLEILERVYQRFGHMVQVVKKPGGEKQFLIQPTTQSVISLINESLRRLTPWDTACVVEPGFDVTDIPGFYFSETSNGDEDLIEMNRVHAVLDPVCLSRFADGLSNYVRTLPARDPDNECDYTSVDERLAIPRFSNYPAGPPRGDRFHPPELTQGDYVRAQRTLEARAHRRKFFTPKRVSIYIDDILIRTFAPRKVRRVRCLIEDEANLIEVRGRDSAGALTLATLLLHDDQLRGEAFRGTITHPGGQKVTVRLTPLRDTDGATKGVRLEVSYTESSLVGPAFRLARLVWLRLAGVKGGKDQASVGLKPAYARSAIAVVAVALIIAAFVLLWRKSAVPTQSSQYPVQQVNQPQGEERAEVEPPAASATPTPPPISSLAAKETHASPVSVAWGRDPGEALSALSMENTRGEARVIDLSHRKVKVALSIPVYDEGGRPYSRYRLTLSAAGTPFWRQTLRAPRVSLTGYAHIIDIVLLTRKLPKAGTYELRVEGHVQGSRRALGHVTFSPQK